MSRRPPRRLASALTALLLIVAGPAAAANAAPDEAAPEAQRFGPADVFALRTAGDPQISPDGTQVAYVRGGADIMSDGAVADIVMMATATRRERVVAAGATAPRWSPDGTRLAYIRSGSPGYAGLHVTDLSTGQTRRLTGAVPGSPPIWSPDGRSIAFTRFAPRRERPGYRLPVARPAGARWAAPPRLIDTVDYRTDGSAGYAPGAAQLFVVSVQSGAARQLGDWEAGVDGEPVWAADGGSLFVVAQRGPRLDRSYMTAAVHRVPVAGAPAVVVPTPGLAPGALALSPGGGTLAFTAVRPADRSYVQSGLYVLRLSDGAIRRLDDGLDREVYAPRFAPDGTAVYARYGDRGVERLGRFALTGGSLRVAAGLTDGYSLSRGGLIATVTGTDIRLGNVGVIGTDGRWRPLTALNDALLGARVLGTVRGLDARSSLDGVALGAWLMLPPSAPAGRRHALVVTLHGGPNGHDTPTWSTADQLLAAAGYAVLRVNYRGSTSYGFAFADRVARDFPAPAYADFMSAVDAAVASGFADPDRLFITGGSAGGQLAAWAIGSTDRFRAAVIVKPVINDASAALTSDQYPGTRLIHGAMPWEAPEDYWRHSPLSLVGQVRTPTLLMVGEQDHRTPVSEAAQFYAALRLRQVPAAMALFPDAGHDSIAGTPSRVVATAALTLDWMARHGGLPDPWLSETDRRAAPGGSMRRDFPQRSATRAETRKARSQTTVAPPF